MTIFARVFLPFLLLIYISVETYLKLNQSSICETSGCQLAGELLRFDSIYLNYFGMLGVSILIIIGFLSRKRDSLDNLFLIILYSAIAFEAVILGYQFFVNPEPCIFCMGIFSSLIIIALFANIKKFLYFVPSIIAIGVALSILALPKNQSLITTDGIYLIQSDTCSHCKKVKTFFAQNDIKYTPISVQETNARGFLKSLDINTIPVLIIKKRSITTIIKGDKNIISNFDKPEDIDYSTPPPQESSRLDFSNTFAVTVDEGCAISIVEAPSCDNNVSY